MPVTMLSTSFGALRHTLQAAGADNPFLQQDTPWISHMAAPKHSQDDNRSSSLAAAAADDAGPASSSSNPAPGGLPPTYASFSPVTLSASAPSRSSRRSTILVHQKSPLLLATPPQITRALAYSHPFLLPLNKAAGLLSWTTNDPWESFLLLCAFWAVVLYGDAVVRAAGPIVLVASLIVAMYGRRYSPLSSSGWTEPPSKDAAAAAAANGNAHGAGAGVSSSRTAGGQQHHHHRSGSEVTNTRHQKTLDEIVDTLKEFTGRCNVLLGPALELTDFLSTQRTPTSATTRPALTALFVRILFCTPFWYALTLPPWRIITTRRVVLLLGTLVLTWHARVMRVARAILWRSATVRRAVTAVTGLQFEKPVRAASGGGDGDDDVVFARTHNNAAARGTDSELTKALRKRSHKHGVNATGRDAGVKFTFILYENQRRWVGLGWTQSLFAYERAAWTDEHNNPVPSKDEFELPEVEDGSSMRWRWVHASKWRVDGVADDPTKELDYDGDAGKNGWIYYDNKWQNGRRGADGWGRWTRRRKWYRDAELVEEDDPAETAVPGAQEAAYKSYSTVGERMTTPTLQTTHEATEQQADASSSQLSSSAGSRGFFRKPLIRRSTNQSTGTSASAATSATAVEGAGTGAGTTQHDGPDKRHPRASEGKSDGEAEVDEVGLRVNLALQSQGQGSGGGWGIGDEARMSLE